MKKKIILQNSHFLKIRLIKIIRKSNETIKQNCTMELETIEETLSTTINHHNKNQRRKIKKKTNE